MIFQTKLAPIRRRCPPDTGRQRRLFFILLVRLILLRTAVRLIPFHRLTTLIIASRQDEKTVSSGLGHAQTSTTMNISAHALQESDRKAADAIENLRSKEA